MTVFLNGMERVRESGAYWWDGEQFAWWNNAGNTGVIRWNDRVGKWQNTVMTGPFEGEVRLIEPQP